jgi:hypothetical protein
MKKKNFNGALFKITDWAEERSAYKRSGLPKALALHTNPAEIIFHDLPKQSVDHQKIRVLKYPQPCVNSYWPIPMRSK